MLSLNGSRAAPRRSFIVAVLVLATVAIPAWCVATGMWW